MFNKDYKHRIFPNANQKNTFRKHFDV
ncbi:helix-turn-helix domain-containing protein [Borreliella japonica]